MERAKRARGASGSIRSAVNALDVLEVVVGADGIGVSDVARRLGLPKATAQRVLATLAREGWIAPVPASGRRWAAGSRAIGLAARARLGDPLLLAARPVMRKLRDATDESVILAVRLGTQLVLSERVDTRLPLRVHNEPGTPMPAPLTSVGKAILAHLERAEWELMRAEAAAQFPGLGLPGPDELSTELDAVVRRGFAINHARWHDGAVGIGAAIFGRTGAPVGALAFAVPTTRCFPDRTAELGVTIAQGAAEVSDLLP